MKPFVIAVAVACAAGPVSAQAAVYATDYASLAGTATTANFSFMTSDTLNSRGGYDIMSLEGNVNGSTITSLVPNPNRPAASVVDGYSFDNIYYDAPHILDSDGVLFHTADGLQYNLWNNDNPLYLLEATNNNPDGTRNQSIGQVGRQGTITPPSPPMGAETIFASALTADGGVTTGLYSGRVKITVSGFAQPDSSRFADAFYMLDKALPYNSSNNYYQLTFGTDTLIPLSPAQKATNFIEGGLPAYQDSHIYSFVLDTGALTPTRLHFGFGDGLFTDNSGGYTVSVASVPEPVSWTMMIAGFGAIGGSMRSRRTALISFG